MHKAALIVGAGGIGTALASQLHTSGQYQRIYLTSRRDVELEDGIILLRGDWATPDFATSVCDRLARDEVVLDMVIVTTGTLMDSITSPEKRLQDIEADRLAHSFMTNTIIPMLVAKALIPLMPKTGRTIFAALGARVGSISDNRTGGWYAYRASKAALAMMIRTLAIEVGRTRPDAILALLHPGTVDTDLSRPFQKNVAESKLFTPQQSAAYLLSVVVNLQPQDSGGHFAWDGKRIEA